MLETWAVSTAENVEKWDELEVFTDAVNAAKSKIANKQKKYERQRQAGAFAFLAEHLRG